MDTEDESFSLKDYLMACICLISFVLVYYYVFLFFVMVGVLFIVVLVNKLREKKTKIESSNDNDVLFRPGERLIYNPIKRRCKFCGSEMTEDSGMEFCIFCGSRIKLNKK